MDRNRRLAELLGIEPIEKYNYLCSLYEYEYPDFTADPTLVLEVMVRTDNIHGFAISQGWPVKDGHYCVPVDLILDRKTGKLCDLASEWIGGRKK